MQERQRDRETESQSQRVSERVRVERKQRRWSGEKGEKMDEDDRPWDKTRRRVEQERKGVRVLDRQIEWQFNSVGSKRHLLLD
jgi:hypothetical protein